MFSTLFQRLSGPEHDRIWEILESWNWPTRLPIRPTRSPTASGDGSTRHAHRLQSEAVAARRADDRHDRRRQAQDRGAHPQDRANPQVLLVEHDMDIVRQIGQRITVLHQGQMLAEGPMSEVMNNETVRRVYLGKAKFQ